jgi:hypothetical protein
MPEYDLAEDASAELLLDRAAGPGPIGFLTLREALDAMKTQMAGPDRTAAEPVRA